MNQIGVGTFTVTPKMRQLVNDVLDSGRISYGPMSKQFEQRFAALHGCRFGVLSNSGTSSLQVALQALKEMHGWQDGDEVIVPALTFVATVNIVLHNRMTPVLVDVEPDYYGIDATKIEQAITPRTRAIIPVHLFGQPCDMQSVMAIAQRHNLKVIEDSCECMFVNHHGRSTGSWGDVGCFSTYVAHLLTTGVGGLATTNDPDLAARMRSLVNHGRDGIYIAIDDDKGKSGDALKEVISRRFKFDSIGHSFRITELEAALGLAQLDDWQAMIERRYQNANALYMALSPLEGWLQRPSIRRSTQHAFMMFPIVLHHEPKDALCQHLEAHGIETREMLPLVAQPCYTGMWNPDDYPVARWVDRSGLYIACHQDLTPDDLNRIVNAMQEYFVYEPVSRA